MDEYVKRQLSSVPGHIGFYYKNLVTGETDGSRQTELFQAASVIKLPILAEPSPEIKSRRTSIGDAANQSALAP